MEIINYVGFETKPAGTNFTSLFNKRIEKSKRNKQAQPLVSFGFSGETVHAVKAAKPSGLYLTPKMAAVNIRNGMAFIGANLKAIISVMLGIFCAVLLGITVVKLADYFRNYTGPLTLQEESADFEDGFEVLNKAMASFALEEPDFSSDGTLKDSADDIAQMTKLFRQPVSFQVYKVQSGESISTISKKFGLTNISTLIAVNEIGNVRQLREGQKIKIPSMDGLFYTVERGNTLGAIASKYGISVEELVDVNDLESGELTVGQKLFIPGAKLDSKKLQQAMGELFKSPLTVRYRLTSKFGPRIDPISGARRSHTGVDMACPTGTPIIACGSGTVAASGFHPTYGNYVIIKHANGYQTLYAHMSKVIAQKGQWVSQGTRIGLVGSTGYSTGPHLHLSIYKNGQLVDPFSVIK